MTKSREGEQNRLVKAIPPLATIDFSVKVSAILRLLESDGWSLVAIRGSHRQFKHAVKPGRVTVAGKPSDDLAPGTLNSILKQAGLKL
jgi:predicted RNA binding protein YcfA (HicA-like mRNA interferase family)